MNEREVVKKQEAASDAYWRKVRGSDVSLHPTYPERIILPTGIWWDGSNKFVVKSEEAMRAGEERSEEMIRSHTDGG